MALTISGTVKVTAAIRWSVSIWKPAAGSSTPYAGGTSPVPVTRPSHSGMKPTSIWPPEATTSR